MSKTEPTFYACVDCGVHTTTHAAMVEHWETSHPAKPSESVLAEADRLIHGDRRETYGHPIDDYTCTGTIWGALLTRAGWQPGTPVPPELCCLMMDGVKASREAGHPKRDNRVDGPGYWGCADMIHAERERRAR